MAAIRRVLTVCLIGMVACTVPARADIIAQTAQGFVSRNVVVVAGTPAAVWKRLVTPSVWWSPDHTFSGDAANLSLDSMPGGCFCERLPGEAVPVKGAKPGTVARGALRGGVEHMHVVYAERGKALRMTGALGPLQSEAVNATLTVTLKPVDGGTRIIFEYVVGGYIRYPADKIVPAIDTVLGNQLLSLAHTFAPGSASQTSDKSDTTSQTAQNAGPADATAPAGQGLDKRGLLLPRGRIWSLPPSDAAPPPVPPAPAAVVAPLQTAAVPQDVMPSGGDEAKAKRAKPVQQPVAREPVAAEPVVAQPAATPVTPDAAAPESAPVASAVSKKRGKAGHNAPTKPVTLPKIDEPSIDAVNSVFNDAVGDPQGPVSTTQ
jgi:hypothetical protein